MTRLRVCTGVRELLQKRAIYCFWWSQGVGGMLEEGGRWHFYRGQNYCNSSWIIWRFYAYQGRLKYCSWGLWLSIAVRWHGCEKFAVVFACGHMSLVNVLVVMYFTRRQGFSPRERWHLLPLFRREKSWRVRQRSGFVKVIWQASDKARERNCMSWVLSGAVILSQRRYTIFAFPTALHMLKPISKLFKWDCSYCLIHFGFLEGRTWGNKLNSRIKLEEAVSVSSLCNRWDCLCRWLLSGGKRSSKPAPLHCLCVDEHISSL